VDHFKLTLAQTFIFVDNAKEPVTIVIIL